MYVFNPVDPQLKRHFDNLMEVLGGALDFSDLKGARATHNLLTEQTLAQLPPEPAVLATDLIVPGPPDNPELPVRLYRPVGAGGQMPAILWIHGGGLVSGHAGQDEGWCNTLCKELRCVVASVEYRLAPEHKYPAAPNDCYAALNWLRGGGAALNIDAGKVAVGGNSAGGGLSAALALKVRDNGGLPFCFQLLVYPMIDDANVLQVDDAHPDTVVWSRANNLFGWRSYLGDLFGGDKVPHCAAPFRAMDLSNLPPTLMVAAELDLFLEENLVYAQRLMKAGVPTALHVYPGAFHGFHLIATESDSSKHCTAAILHNLGAAFS